MRRRLLGWDPLDGRLLQARTNSGSAQYGCQNTAATDADNTGSFGLFDAFGQAMWALKATGVRRGASGIGTVYRGHAIWDTNPYMAWAFAWHTPTAGGATRPRFGAAQSRDIDTAVWWITALFQAIGMWHGPGWLDGKPSSEDSKKPEFAGKVAVHKYRAMGVPHGDRACSLAEVLDLNMGGCHTNATVALSLLRSQCVPAVISKDLFLGFGSAGAIDAVPGTHGEARLVKADSITGDGDSGTATTGHSSLIAGFRWSQRVLQHGDRLLADRLGAFADPSHVWVPFEEHLVALTALNNRPWMLQGAQRCMAAHEQRRTRTVAVNAGKHWMTHRAAAAQFDKERLAMVTPYATSRLAWFRAAERTLNSGQTRTFTAGPWLEQAKALLANASSGLPPGADQLEAALVTSVARQLAARLLGIDCKSIWKHAITEIPSVVQSSVLSVYLSAAPWPPNFDFTSRVGQYPYDYETSEGSNFQDPKSVHGVLVLAVVLLLDVSSVAGGD